MDLIVTLGYKGQDIHFFDSELLAFVTGRALCIYGLSKGPRDMIWRNIKNFAVNFEEKVFISISHDSTTNLELVRLSDQSIITSAKNPSSAELISISFSRKGDRLYALSGSIDHRILVWNIKESQMQLIISNPMTSVSRNCIPNPCDSDYYVLIGDEGVVVGVIKEIFEEYSSKLFPVIFDENLIIDDDLDENFQFQNKILFCIWLPGNRILAGSSQGFLFEVDVEIIISALRDKSSNYNRVCQRYLGKFFVDDVGNGAGEYYIPTCAVATSTHLIVGTEEGYLYWYQFIEGISSNSGNNLNCKKVHQKSSTRGQPISCLTIDPKYQTVVAGTFSGEIFKVSSEIQVSLTATSNNGPLEDNDIDAGETHPLESIELVELDTVGSEMNFGNVLISKSLSVGIEKLNGRVKGTLSLLVTGSHLGVLTFWKQPIQQVESMTIGGGVRRSNPRPMNSILNVNIGQSKSKNPLLTNRNPSISCMEMIPWIEKPNAQFICIGTDDGWLEVWILEALENEEDEVRGDTTEMKLVEDDEGGVFVRLDVKKVFDSRIYTSSITCLTPAIFSTDDKNFFNICTASLHDNRIFMVTVMVNDAVVLKTSNNSFSIASSSSSSSGHTIRSLNCSGDQLQVWCESGDIYIFDLLVTTEHVDPMILKKSGLLSINSMSPFKRLPAYLVLDGSSDMYYVPAANVSVGLESSDIDNNLVDLEGTQRFSHEDIVTFLCHSPNGRYLATGCVNGTLYIWKLDHEGSVVSLANQLCLHSGAVTCLTFSVCSSFIMSHGIDGSCFLFSVDRVVSKGVLRSSVNLSKLSSGESLSVKDINVKLNDTLMTWSQMRESEKIKEMQSHYKFKTMGINAAITEISNRLRVLLDQNSNRNELERMEDFEFVINEQRRDDLLQSNAIKVITMKEQYKRKNLWHELRAGRVKMKCWDPLESSSSTLLPFANSFDAKGYNLFVTSFSVEKITSDWNEIAVKVMRLRAIEIRTMRNTKLGFVKRIPGMTYYRSAWNNSLKGCPPNTTWISCEGFRWPVNEQIEMLLNGEKVIENKEKNGQVNVVSSEEEEDANYLEDESELDEMNILNLLYPPQAVRTQLQKRTQMVLLKEVVRQLRIKFNKKYEQLYKEKEEIIMSIESRNSRIKTILSDLHQEEEMLTPKFSNLEIPGSAIKISDEELLNRPYETESARLKRIREEEERKRKELENDKEDVKGRALDEMMYGTLEVKRDVFAEASSLVKPEWMDVLAPSEMNESQLKEYDAYQQKMKAILEEQANYRKVLEQEIKKLKSEIVDLCKMFDEKLEELSKLKIVVHREILSNEIYISRIAMNMAKTEQNWKYLKRTEDQIVSLRKERSEIRTKIDKFNLKLEDIKTQIGLLQEDERQMDKSFKRDLQNLCNTTFDQDTLKVFTQLYRLRVYPKGAQFENTEVGEEPSETDYNQSQQMNRTGRNKLSSSRSKKSSSQSRKLTNSQSRKLNLSGQENAQTKGRMKMKSSTKGTTTSSSLALGPMQLAAQALNAIDDTNAAVSDKDPYYDTLMKKDLQKKTLENQIPIVTTLNLEIDCPEGFIVDQFTWSKLQELRITRIEKEISVKRLTLEFNEIKQKLETMDIDEAILVNNINDMKSNRDSSLLLLKSLESDLDLIVCLRQGQDEVEKDAVVTDYNNALLIPSDVIGKYNTRIKELGKEKINILSKIKQFRRKINLIDWEAKHNSLEATHYEAYLTDLQLFRVTRELQRVIRDGSDANQVKERLDKVSMRKDYMTKDAEEKITNLKSKNDALKRQLFERNQECFSLDNKIKHLRSEVVSFQDVKNSRDEARGLEGNPANIAANKMKKVVNRRHMVDTARAQAEEIDFLRQELDKMRQRTFPSFVRATKKRLTMDQN